MSEFVTVLCCIFHINKVLTVERVVLVTEIQQQQMEVYEFTSTKIDIYGIFEQETFTIAAFVNLRIFILIYWSFLVHFLLNESHVDRTKILNCVTNHVSRKKLPLEGAIGSLVL